MQENEEVEREPGHDEIWLMYMAAETKAPHQFEQEMQQTGVSWSTGLVQAYEHEKVQPVSSQK